MIEKDDYGEHEVYDFSKDDISFTEYEINLSKKPKTYIPLVTFGKSVVMSRCSLSAITGKAKSRKSTLVSLLCQKYLTETNGKILIIDTEQAEYYVHKNAQRLHKMMGWRVDASNERFITLQFRGAATDKRFELFSKAVKHYRPDLIFLDGVRDLLKDFNNINEVVSVVDELMRLTEDYKCHISCVLHENKGDNNMRGHLGTEIQNKAETVIGINYDQETSTAEPRYTRNIPFHSFEYGYNKDGIPEFFTFGMIGQRFEYEQSEIDMPILPNRNFETEKQEDSMPF